MDNIVSKDEFWNLMCKAAFRRISEKKGTIGNNSYYCFNPPNMAYANEKMKELIDENI